MRLICCVALVCLFGISSGSSRADKTDTKAPSLKDDAKGLEGEWKPTGKKNPFSDPVAVKTSKLICTVDVKGTKTKYVDGMAFELVEKDKARWIEFPDYRPEKDKIRKPGNGLGGAWRVEYKLDGDSLRLIVAEGDLKGEYTFERRKKEK